jgi:hypothetical protein
MDKKRENKKLIERYPFLLPWHRLTGKHPTEFDFGFTELDAMPDGWRVAFGEDICKEIMEELVQNDCVDTYRILQIKEKYGQLHWYSQGGTERIHHEIVPKYEKMSRRICVQCGQPATLISLNWITPQCDTCAEKLGHQKCEYIDEFYGSKCDID